MNTNNTTTKVKDERLAAINEKSMAAAGTVATFCNLALMIYGGITEDFKIAIIAIAQLILMSIAATVIMRKNDELNLPTTITGKTVNTELTKKGSFNRFLHCFSESLFFSLGVTLFNYFIDGERGSELVTTAVVFFVVSFVLDTIMLKHKVKKYHKLMAEYELDDAE